MWGGLKNLPPDPDMGQKYTPRQLFAWAEPLGGDGRVARWVGRRFREAQALAGSAYDTDRNTGGEQVTNSLTPGARHTSYK